MAGGWLLAAALAFGLTPPAWTAPAPTPAAGEGAPSPSLPRLRPLWSARGLMDAPSAHARTAVRAGTLLAWAYDAPTALVALDLRTGRERWRMPTLPTPTRSRRRV